MALLAYSHVLTTMVVTALLILTAIVLFRKTFTAKVFGKLAAAVAMFIGLSAAAVIPMLDYMMSDTYLVSGSSYIMRGFYPGWRELFELIPSGTGSGIAFDLRMPTAIGAALTAVLAAYAVSAVIRFVLSVRNKSLKKNASAVSPVKLYLFILAGITLFISSKYFPWTYIESKHNALTALLCSIQFSWRYIGIASVLTVFLGALTVRDIRKKNRRMGTCLAVLLAVLAVIPALVLECRACTENNHVRINAGSDIGIVGDELYYPTAWNREADYERAPEAQGSAVTEDFEIDRYRWTVKVSSDGGEGSVVFPVVYYKGYKSVTESGQVLVTYQSEDGRVAVKIPSGFSGSFVMRFTVPALWRISELVTFVSVIFICFAIHANSKKDLSGKEVSSSD